MTQLRRVMVSYYTTLTLLIKADILLRQSFVFFPNRLPTFLSGRSCVCIVLFPPLFRTAHFSALRCPLRHRFRFCWPRPRRKAGPLGTVRLGKEKENTIISPLTWNSPIICNHQVIQPSNHQGNLRSK